ncbi:hypothetical protein SAMN05428984_0947 [Sphingomonas sp. OK281]|nr:hypothetical protein SAMN05428984_0947 [Sphingomonas sp. OK281]
MAWCISLPPARAEPSIAWEDLIKTITIVGHNISDIPSFYAEINRVMMADESWALGESLDAFDDLFYGGYGAIAGHADVTIVWQDIETSRSALGYETTRAFLRGKLRHPEIYDIAAIGRQLDALENGDGRTYFETVVAIVGDHDHVTLVGA